MRTPNNNFTDRKRKTYQRHFEVEVNKETDQSLNYFIRQELAYYNSIIELLTPRLRTFPGDLLSMKDKELKLWEVCSEFAIDPNILLKYPDAIDWPSHLQPYFGLLYDIKGVRISKTHLNIIQIASSSARILPVVRKNIAIELLQHMIKQADIIHSTQKTDTMKTPLQLLNIHTIDTKRHVQIPSNLVKIKYSEDIDSSDIEIPYSKIPIVIPGADLTDSKFSLLILRSSHTIPNVWNVEIKDNEHKYLIGLSDYNDKKKRINETRNSN